MHMTKWVQVEFKSSPHTSHNIRSPSFYIYLSISIPSSTYHRRHLHHLISTNTPSSFRLYIYIYIYINYPHKNLIQVIGFVYLLFPDLLWVIGIAYIRIIVYRHFGASWERSVEVLAWCWSGVGCQPYRLISVCVCLYSFYVNPLHPIPNYEK